MLEKKFFALICLVALVAGCSGGGPDPVSAGSGTDLRAASGTAPTNPGSADSVESTGTTTVAPTGAATTAVTTEGTTTGTPTGAVTAYDPTALPIVGGEPSASGTWPAWRRSMSRWEWKQLPGTDISAANPDPRPAGSTGPNARIDAWNGLAADTRTSRLFSAANGGHTDYSGNEVVQIDLSSDTPRWTMLRAPSAPEDVLYSNASLGLFYDYYRDGRPTSTHSYYALQFLPSRNAIFRFGAGAMWGTGPEQNWKTDSFSLSNNDWHPAGTWPDVVPGSRQTVYGASTCLSPTTDEVYITTSQDLRRFNPVAGNYSVMAVWSDLFEAAGGRPCAVDTLRNRVVYFGDNYRMPVGGIVFDVGSKTFSRFSFTGAAAAEMLQNKRDFVWYEPKVGKFLLKSAVGDRVYSIDPGTFDVTPVATAGGGTLPDAANGVHTRWQRLPSLGGYAYYPKAVGGVWFLAIE